jgi:hypothetical protein
MQMLETVDQYHRVIILVLAFAVLAMVVSCTFDEAIPICHWIFRCG